MHTTLHCRTRCIIQAKEVPTVKDELDFESQPPPLQQFLTEITKNNSPTKIEKLGTWQASILFINLWRFFLILYRGTQG